MFDSTTPMTALTDVATTLVVLVVAVVAARGLPLPRPRPLAQVAPGPADHAPGAGRHRPAAAVRVSAPVGAEPLVHEDEHPELRGAGLPGPDLGGHLLKARRWPKSRHLRRPPELHRRASRKPVLPQTELLPAVRPDDHLDGRQRVLPRHPGRPAGVAAQPQAARPDHVPGAAHPAVGHPGRRVAADLAHRVQLPVRRRQPDPRPVRPRPRSSGCRTRSGTSWR